MGPVAKSSNPEPRPTRCADGRLPVVKLRELLLQEYRSIRNLRIRLEQVNVVIGPNGCGKTNLYQGLRLLSAAAGGELSRRLGREGGLGSALWAGQRRKGPVRLVIGATVDEFEYQIALGLPPPPDPYDPNATKFALDPEVKEEHLWVRERGRKHGLLERRGPTAFARDAEGMRVPYPLAFAQGESVLSELREPHRFPVLSTVHQEVLRWRFYHDFRTDAASPIRQPQVGVRTPALSHDGEDLAAALRTIIEIGDVEKLYSTVARAFPGAELEIQTDPQTFQVLLKMPDFHRPFDAKELSDGTLKFLCLAAALLSPRPPAFLALNEPEASLHPSLLVPLADLIVSAGRRSQVWVTTHSEVLARHIAETKDARLIELEKVQGETRVVGQGLLGDVEIEE